MFKKAYTFDDVCLVPQFSNLTSRLEPDTSTWLTKDIKIDIPIVNAPMDTVIGYDMADSLIRLGTIPIFARSNKIDKYTEIFNRYGNKPFVSVGANDPDFIKEVLDLGFDKILIDTANGHTKQMYSLIEGLKMTFRVSVMAGNVATPMGYVDLVNAGADCVRVGIGPGAACTTRIKTGVGVPQFSAVVEVAEMAKKFKVPFISDGGINGPRELCLAVAGGATTVMIGKLLALTEQSAAEKRGGNQNYTDPSGSLTTTLTTPREAKYRGQASADYQKDNYGKVKAGTVAEGVSFWAPVSGSVDEAINELVGGLRSSMTYLGAKNIKEYQTKAEFREVTSAYMVESKPRTN